MNPQVSALGTFESHRMPGARGCKTCAASGDLGGGMTWMDGDLGGYVDR